LLDKAKIGRLPAFRRHNQEGPTGHRRRTPAGGCCLMDCAAQERFVTEIVGIGVFDRFQVGCGRRNRADRS
jgi:hypothetical protein